MLKSTDSINQRGFTLVEVLASVVILSILLLGVSNLLVTTSKIAASNNERLVAINVGKATIERIKVNPRAYFDLGSHENINSVVKAENPAIYDGFHCLTEECKQLYEIKLNDKLYTITIIVSQNEKEEELNLLDVVVNVDLDGSLNHKVEGYIRYES